MLSNVPNIINNPSIPTFHITTLEHWFLFVQIKNTVQMIVTVLSEL
jgi:hypothetical protein